jgi:hypothetical protein
LFDREAQGVTVQQLITDSGRTPNLVASARFQAQAAAQNSQATRFTVLLDVNRAYFDVLHAQATVKVAEQTVAARQLLDDQVTELARNKLRSQVDVSFADVNVSEAKLLLLRAQDSVQGALAELGRAMGSDQPANYQLSDEPLPPAPPATPDASGCPGHRQPPRTCVAARVARCRPQIRRRRKRFDASHRQRVAVGGYIPYINTPYHADSSRIRRRRRQRQHSHLQRPFVSARREAAYQRAWNPIRSCAMSSSGSAAMFAWLGPARTTPTSASTSPRSFCGKPRWRCNWRRDATI